MKKLISVLLSVMMVISVGALSVMPVMASTVSSGEPTPTGPVITGQVNGETSNQVSFEASISNPSQFTFTYNGGLELLGWEFSGIVEGADYTVVADNGNTITIALTASGMTKQFVANAKVKQDAKPGSETNKPGASDKDNTGKSPSTGAAMTGILVAGAGIAMLAASKKKN